MFFEIALGEKITDALKTGLAPKHQTMAKLLVTKMREHRCEMCKIDVWVGKPVPLVLDHINGNSGDWRLENLRLICGNCDMLLPTYKSKNRGKGRSYDREYRRSRIGKRAVMVAGLS